MTAVCSIKGFRIRVGGQQHSGWLPDGAATPLPTPVRDEIFNLEIDFDGSGYLLLYSSLDGSLYGDTWHTSLSEAKQAAFEYFGIESAQWQAA